MSIYDLIILGSGPAGLTAAIYAGRAGLQPLVIEGAEPGGQLTITTEVENYPGFPDGIMGPDLMLAMRKQAERFGTRIIAGEVDRVEFNKRPFTIGVGDKNFSCRVLITATGASVRWLGLPSEQKLRGHGVSACATCDGFFFKGQDVVVVGGGDTALEEALFLTKFAKSVAIVHRRDKLRAGKALEIRARANPKISFVWDSIVDDIKDADLGKVTAIRLKDVKTGVVAERPCGGVFVAIGHEPNTKLFVDKLGLDPKGYIKVKPGSTATNVEGVFAAGDVADPLYRQAVTAAGAGCMAAIEAERCLR